MTEEPNSIPVPNSVELIRRRPAMFFENGKADMSQLIAAVLRDAGGDGEVTALREGEFAIVCSPADWLAHPTRAPAVLFAIFTPNGLQNDHRAEVLLEAVCDGVITAGPCGNYARDLALADLPSEFLALAQGSARFLAWKFSGAHSGKESLEA